MREIPALSPAAAESGRRFAPLMRVKSLTKSFGGVTAVNAIDLEIEGQQILGVIGPNGAGKSTLIGLLSGAHRADGGNIYWRGQDVTTSTPVARARGGIGRTHQIPRPFAQMTVTENLLLGQYFGAGVRDSHEARNSCRDILRRTGLEHRADEDAGKLQLLDRKRLELARALSLQPRLLLLDEIGAGLLPAETNQLIELILSLRQEVEAILIVEHVLEVISRCCDRVVVLDSGRVLATGAPGEVLASEEVASAYLGTSAHVPKQLEHAAPERPAAAVPAESPSRDTGRAGSELLRIENLQVQYRGIRALRGISLEIREREIVALLGANGAGKTSLARAVGGVVAETTGSIFMAGERIDARPAHQRAALGIAHCMEGRRIFGDLTVEENLLLGAGSAAHRERLEEIYALFPDLVTRRRASGKVLSGGQQQMLAIGRALMAKPKLIIFDEISLGLAPVAVERLYEALIKLRPSGIAMLLIEQNIDLALAVADWAYVLVHGEIRLEGAPRMLLQSPELKRLYFS